jgi:hypothetical protein
MGVSDASPSPNNRSVIYLLTDDKNGELTAVPML